ncbi:MAG: divalent metal cation transporter [Patescibacteria group bacterium]
MISLVKRWFLRVSIILSVVGPGIIAGTADNDAGGITTYSVVGAHYGYQMLWLLPLVGLVLWLTQDMGARLGLVTGKGLAALIRENFSIRLTVLVILLTSVSNWLNVVAEFAGVASVAQLYHIPKTLLVAVAAFAISFVVIKGNFQIVQRVFLTSSVLYLAYLIAGWKANPDWTTIFHSSFTPHFSLESGFLFTAIALVGTTVTAWGQFFIQSYYVDKGVKDTDIGLMRWDITAGTLWTVVVAFFIVVATASTLYPKGIQIYDASQAAAALEPFAGYLAKHLFAWGLLNASLLGAGVVTIATSYLITEAFGWEGKVDLGLRESPVFYKLFLFFIVSASLFVLIPSIPLVPTIVFSQALNAMVLPLLFICMTVLLNRKDIMGTGVNSPMNNSIIIIAIAVVCVLNISYCYSLITQFLKLL